MSPRDCARNQVSVESMSVNDARTQTADERNEGAVFSSVATRAHHDGRNGDVERLEASNKGVVGCFARAQHRSNMNSPLALPF